MKALIQDDLLRHSDVDVKVAVASCISEITKITAPHSAYKNDQMRGLSSWTHIFINGKYNDLGFGRKRRNFLNLYWLLLKTYSANCSKVREDVLKKYAEKLKPYLMPAPTALGDALDAHTEIVTRVCEGIAAATTSQSSEPLFSTTSIKEPPKIEKPDAQGYRPEPEPYEEGEHLVQASGKLIVLDIAVMISQVDLAAMGGGAPPSGWLIGFLQFLLTPYVEPEPYEEGEHLVQVDLAAMGGGVPSPGWLIGFLFSFFLRLNKKAESCNHSYLGLIKLHEGDGKKSNGNNFKLYKIVEIRMTFYYLDTFMVRTTKLIVLMLIGSYGRHTHRKSFSFGVVLGTYKWCRSFEAQGFCLRNGNWPIKNSVNCFVVGGIEFDSVSSQRTVAEEVSSQRTVAEEVYDLKETSSYTSRHQRRQRRRH
ncbi:armadillo-type fold protein [Tanacetum coccineum]